MIVDVVFDLPVPHPFSYRVPSQLRVTPGQRVRAPLGTQARVGLVVATREGEEEELKPIVGLAESGPILSPSQLELTRWIAGESLSSWGSSVSALLPPAPRAATETTPPPPHWSRSSEERPWLLTGGDRERRLLARLEKDAETRGILVLAPEIDQAAAWADRLSAALKGPVARLDSGVAGRQRWHAWMRLARGVVRVGVGTRSALLAPVPAPATLVVLDENDPAHKPPGPPRIHSREVMLERAKRDTSRLYLTAGTPSVESWWRSDEGEFHRSENGPSPWPHVAVVDVRGTLRTHPLSPALRHAMKETLSANGRVLLLVTRIGSAMACGECGFVLRCPECRIAMVFSRARRELACRLCRRTDPAPETCPHCRGRQLAPLGWGTERVEQAVRAEVPRYRVARYDAESRRGRAITRAMGEGSAHVVVGTRAALKAFHGPALVGFISPDPILRLPDFRAGERAFALFWAAAERVAEGGRVVIQTQHPTHYAVRAAAGQELASFYKHELKFRAELGYPPFRRICLITVSGRADGAAKRLAGDLERELQALGELTVYPPAPLGRSPKALRWQIVLKGGDDLPARLHPALSPFLARRREGRGIIEVEMDPVDLA
ncbi:MAG: primosomal protein N' [Candidatus Rokubacteria bacterium]|nr:primosomal protein N' [Candidatus Rokubacteria bacterium]